MTKYLVEATSDWTFPKLYEVYDEIEKISNEMGFNTYRNQIEIITSEQMLDAYSAIGMPIFYKHWSFGKQFLKNKTRYDKGQMGLAYEIVINSDPCISYLMENNSMLMQTLVIAHAGIGHNHFFKNNNLFLEWTNPSGIIEYLEYSQAFLYECEEKYGIEAVEKILDAAHSLMNHAIFKYPRKEKLSFEKEKQRRIDVAKEDERQYNEIWNLIPKHEQLTNVDEEQIKKRKAKFNLPEENILYFLETYSPILRKWEREVLRIVRNISQYFYPQSQTKIMNEGCATWTHYTIINKMYDRGLISPGAMMEFIQSHTGVTFQPEFDSKYYSGINPYAIGFAMMNDIERICDNPTQEDKDWFPKIAGCKDSFNVLKDAWANYRDESFIRQYLSPEIMRKFKLFTVMNKQHANKYLVTNIHNNEGFEQVRELYANSLERIEYVPNIEISDVDMTGDRTLYLDYEMFKNRKLSDDQKSVLKHISTLWGYNVRLNTVKQGDIFDKITVKNNNNANSINDEEF